MKFIVLTFVVSTSAYMLPSDPHISASLYNPGMINMPRGNGRRDSYSSGNGWEDGKAGIGRRDDYSSGNGLDNGKIGIGRGSGVPSTDVEHEIIGGGAGVRKDSNKPTQYNVETGLIGGNAGIRHDNNLLFSNGMITRGNAGTILQKRGTDVTSGTEGRLDGVKSNNVGTNPSGPNDWILNGGRNVKPWKSVTPDFNKLTGMRQNVKRDTGNMIIGGSAGVRKDNRDNAPSGRNDWILNGGNDVKPWKTFKPEIRGIPRNN